MAVTQEKGNLKNILDKNSRKCVGSNNDTKIGTVVSDPNTKTSEKHRKTRFGFQYRNRGFGFDTETGFRSQTTATGKFATLSLISN